MYKAKNMNIIMLHFKGSVSFEIFFFEIKDKNLLINKFFTESKNHFCFQVTNFYVFSNTIPLHHYITSSMTTIYGKG